MKNDEDKVLSEDFYKKIAKKSHTTEDQSKEFVHILFDYIGDSLVKEEKVGIYQFGIFNKKWTKAKPGINPQTKEKIIIPAHNKISFHPSSILSNLVNKKYRNKKPNVLDEMLALTGFRKNSEEETRELESTKELKEEHGKAKKRALITLIISALVILALLAVLIFVPAYYVNENSKIANYVKSVNQMLGLNAISDALAGKQEVISKEKVGKFLEESKQNLSKDRKIIDTYTVSAGDSIFSIAKKYWQDEYLWPDLYLLNRTEFSDPDVIFPKDKVVIYEKLGDPKNFSKKERDQVVQAYIGIYRIYRALGEKDIAVGKERKNKALINYGLKRINDSRWTLYTAVRYDHDLLKKYKEAIYPDDVELLTKYVERFGFQGKKE
jgi:nucleoid DNA-binding protein